jgi:hypothetical protein
MGNLVRIMDAVVLKRDRNRKKILRDKMIGEEGDAAAIEEAVGEVPRGGRRQRQRPLQALARMLHVPMCSTSRSLLEDLANSGATTTSSGEGNRFVLLVRGRAGRFFQVAM